MSKIKVNWNFANTQVEELKNIKNELSEYEEAIDKIARHSSIHTIAFGELYRQLSGEANNLRDTTIAVENLKNGLFELLNLYTKCETEILEENLMKESIMKESLFNIKNFLDGSLEIISQAGVLGQIVGMCKGVASSKTAWSASMNIFKGMAGVTEKFANLADKINVNWKDVLEFNKEKIPTFKKIIKDLYKGENAVESMAKKANLASDFVIELADNLEEHGKLSERAIAETVIETGTNLLLNVGTKAVVAGGLAALGVASAPVAAVAAITAGVTFGANLLVEHFTEKDIGEHASDFILDTVVPNAKNIFKSISDSVGKFGKSLIDSNASARWAENLL